MAVQTKKKPYEIRQEKIKKKREEQERLKQEEEMRRLEELTKPDVPSAE